VQELCDVGRVDNEIVNDGMMPAVSGAVVCLALMIAAGRPLHVRVTDRIVIDVNERVTATIVDPVYVGDRVAIPSGAPIAGRIVAVQMPSSTTRVRDAGGGDFTAHDVAVLRFDTLTLGDGRRIPIATTVDAGRDHAAASAGQWVKEYVLGQLPVHRRYVHAGAEYTVTLVEPVTVDADGTTVVRQQLRSGRRSVGRVRARLVTPLDSAAATRGMPVRVIVTEPFVDRRGTTVLEGTTLDGTIIAVTHAGGMHRHGRLEFEIGGMRGVATIEDSKWRFALPILAAWALSGAPDRDRGHLGNFLGRGGAGWSGFEMIGGAIGQASGPIAIGFGAWGVARGIWINVLSKGHDVVLPANSLVELTAS
jgi:hypothetical protein